MDLSVKGSAAASEGDVFLSDSESYIEVHLQMYEYEDRCSQVTKKKKKKKKKPGVQQAQQTTVDTQ
jgi:hypothetical protein